jgi:hypothetical protein
MYLVLGLETGLTSPSILTEGTYYYLSSANTISNITSTMTLAGHVAVVAVVRRHSSRTFLAVVIGAKNWDALRVGRLTSICRRILNNIMW